MYISSSLKLNELIVQIKLGISEQEREVPQNVHIGIELKFNTPPKACITDNIEDTVCYSKIAKKIIGTCQDKEYQLIEFLCQEVFSLIRSDLESSTKIKISITKLNPPIVGIATSVNFEYSDF
jgi:7,8-dihydroneopterin aldolase/epimerase/oxygenase